MTNAEARFNKSLRPRKPEGSLGRTAQDVHLDSHTAPELCCKPVLGAWTYPGAPPRGDCGESGGGRRARRPCAWAGPPPQQCGLGRQSLQAQQKTTSRTTRRTAPPLRARPRMSSVEEQQSWSSSGPQQPFQQSE